MSEKYNQTIINLKLYALDIAGAGVASVTLEKAIIGEGVHILTTITATFIGGSLLFVAQKTILPKLVDYINSKL